MKKYLILLSMVAMLAACSSAPAPAPKDENALPDGIMQPVDGTGAVSGGSWLPEVQQQSMPENMK